MTRGRRAAVLLLTLASSAALAGPPYVTDDPEPTRTGGWENYVYVTGATLPGATAGQAGLELNYGGAPNLQISAALPLSYEDSRGVRAGLGDVYLGAKYRFLHPPAESWLPDAAIFPSLDLPSAAHAFGTTHTSVFLPVWLQKDFSRWSSFGGGGYTLNPGAGQRNFWLLGWAVTRPVGERLNLGLEIYHQTPSFAGGAAQTNLGFGAVFQVTRNWALMASGGPQVQRPSRNGASAFYVSVQFTN